MRRPRSILVCTVLAPLGVLAACSVASEDVASTDQAASIVLPSSPSSPTPPSNATYYPATSPSCPPGQFGAGDLPVKGAVLTDLGKNCAYEGACTFSPPVICGSSFQTILPLFEQPIVRAIALGAHATYVIGGARTKVSTTDNRAAVYSWGMNAHYELGTGATTASRAAVATLFIPGNPAKALAAGDEDACALMSDGSVHCWGTIATSPSVVLPTPTPIAFPSGTVVSSLVHGQHHACVLTSTNALYCWGDNDKQQLGDPTSTTGRAAPYLVTIPGASALVSIAAGGRATCAMDAAGTVWCWGDNERGLLGNGAGIIGGVNGSANDYTATPQRVVQPYDNFGDPIGFQAPLVGGGAGSFCGNTVNGRYCWGANDEGQAGVVVYPSAGLPTLPFIDMTSPYPAESSVIGSASTFALGANHSCVIGVTPTDTLYADCFGANQSGQLGNGTTTASWQPTPLPNASGALGFSQLAMGANHSCGIIVAPAPAAPVTLKGTTPSPILGYVACWGANDSGQTGRTISTEPAYLSWL